MAQRIALQSLLGALCVYACVAPHYGIDPRLDEETAGNAGAAGSGASSGDAGSGGTDSSGGTSADPSGSGAGGDTSSGGSPNLVVEEGGACDMPDAYACLGTAKPGRLQCADGVWTVTDDCPADHHCDTSSGDCLPIVAGCTVADQRFCGANQELIECGVDWVTTSVVGTCENRCVEIGSSASCVPASCGDSTPQAPEECDDGDEDDTDECTGACQDARCGDTVIWKDHETCDDGDTVEAACEYDLQSCMVCNANCQEVAGATSYCGDGVLLPAEEQCDGGIADDAHRCNPSCDLTTWALTQLPGPSPMDYAYHIEYAIDFTTDLMWERTIDPTLRTWEGAKTYCAQLTKFSETDWRLPTRVELMSLVDYTKTTPPLIVSGAVFDDPPGGEFWTSIPRQGNELVAYYVDFTNGWISTLNKTQTAKVRCVRSN